MRNDLFSFVGMRGFEPPASGPPDQHSNRAELHPESGCKCVCGCECDLVIILALTHQLTLPSWSILDSNQ
jgi:hypothetical protein